MDYRDKNLISTMGVRIKNSDSTKNEVFFLWRFAEKYRTHMQPPDTVMNKIV